MTLWEWLSSWVERKATQPTALRVPDANVIDGSARVPLRPDKDYVHIWLRQMCLAKDREWFTTRLPAVHSLIVLKFGDQVQELANVAGQAKLQIGLPELNKAKLLSYELTGLLPFRGGTVNVDCGLASMRGSDVMGNFIGVVSDFASKLTLPQVSAAANIAQSVTSSVQSLLGAGETKSKLYYHDAFAADGGGARLKPGYIFVSEKRDGTIKAEKIWVKNGEVWFGLSANDLTRPDPHDYILIEIATTDHRNDWRHLKNISEPFNDAVATKLSGDTAKADLLYNQAIMAVVRSADLTEGDKVRVMIALRDFYKDPYGGGTSAEGEGGAIEAARTMAPTIAEALAFRGFDASPPLA